MLKHFFTNSAGILTSRVLGLLRDFLTAKVLGASIYSDIFFVAFKLPNLFRRLFGEGAFTQSFLPNFVAQRKKGLFLAEVLVSFLAFMLLFSALVMIFAPLVTKLLAAGFDDATVALAVPLVRINFWYLTFIFCVTLFSGVLQFKNHFATTAFSTALLNLSMITALILARNLGESEVVFWLSWGVVVGGVLQLLVHIVALKRLGLWRLFTLGLAKFRRGKRAQSKGFWRNFGAGVVGSSANQIGDFVSTFVASFLATGGISYLYYANRIFQLPLALFAMALSIAIFPQISRKIKAKNEKEALNLLTRGCGLLTFLLLFASVGGILLAPEIIWLIFERGAFTRTDTFAVALVLQGYLLGLLPFGLAKLFSLWLYAHFMQAAAAKISVGSLVVNVVLSFVLFKPLGAFGLAVASSVSGLFLLVGVLWVFGFRRLVQICHAKFVVLILLSGTLFGVAVWWVKGLVGVV